MNRTSARKAASPKSKASTKKKIAAETETKVSRTHKPEEMELEEWQTCLRKQALNSLLEPPDTLSVYNGMPLTIETMDQAIEAEAGKRR